MERIIIDVCTGWEYELKGEQYYPTGRVMKDGVMTPQKFPEDNEPEEELCPLGVWAWRHLRFIRQNKKSLYLDLVMSGTLNAYLTEIDTQAEDLFSRLVKEMAEKEGVNERLKAADQMHWVQSMNNIRNRAAEIVNNDMIYV